MRVDHLPLCRFRELRQPGHVMVPVSLDALDANRRHHRQVLYHGDWPDVTQIFTAHHGRVPGLSPSIEQARIGDSLENALAVFVARPGVAKCQRLRQAFYRGVRFVDNDRRPIRPIAEVVAHGILERDVAVQRLLDKKQVLEKGSQLRVGGETRPVVVKLPHGFELLIAVKGERVVTWRMLLDDGSDAAQTVVIGVEVAVAFDFEKWRSP